MCKIHKFNNNYLKYIKKKNKKQFNLFKNCNKKKNLIYWRKNIQIIEKPINKNKYIIKE